MKTRWTLAAILLSAALGSAQDQPQPQSEVTLACKPMIKEKPPRVMLTGTAAFPEGTVLKLTLQREFESFAGGYLKAGPDVASGSLVQVTSKKIQSDSVIAGPGALSITLQLIDDYQKPAVLKELKGKVAARQWTFSFPAWGDELIGQLGPKLQEMQAIAAECQAIVKKFEKMSSSESGWIKERRNVDARGADVILTKEADDVVKETAKLIARLDRLDVKALFPAAHAELFYTIRNMHGNSLHYVYEAGRFAGAKSYHTGGEPMKTHREEPFNFENLKKYIDEAIPLAGREYVLWIVKDLRRTNGQLRPDILEGLKVNGQAPGVAFIADRLAKANVADLDEFERQIRNFRPEAPPDEKDKPKPKNP